MIDDERTRRAFKILLYYQHKMRKEIEEIKRKLEEFEQRLNNLFKIGEN